MRANVKDVKDKSNIVAEKYCEIYNICKYMN
nr:MAG TPA: hypothetical protein [Caudoviricetes sp.]